MAAFDNPTNKTTLAGVLQTLISDRLVPQYEKKRVFRGLIGPDAVFEVPMGVNTISKGQRDLLTFDEITASVGEGTEDTPEAFNTAATDVRSFTPVVFSAHALAAWETVNATPIKVMAEMAEAAATARSLLEDSNTTYGFAAQYGESTSGNELGANGTPLSADLVLQGWQKLATAGAFGPYNHVVDPIQVKELMQDSEAKAWLRQKNGDYAATVGVDANRYVGEIHGVQIWRADALYESSGLFSMMFGKYALGYAYKLLSNPLNTTPSEFLPTVQWEDSANAYRVTFRVCMNISGLSDTSTTNRFMVTIVT